MKNHKSQAKATTAVACPFRKAVGLLIIAVLFCSPGLACKKEKAEPIGPSIFQIDSTWVSQDERKMKLEDFRGRPMLFSMLYTNCKMICPRMASDMQKVYNSLNEEQKANLQLVAVSFDPLNDTPERLKQFQAKMGLQGNWTLLNGSESDVRTLAAALGIQYRQTSDGHFTHSTVLLLFNEKGEPIYRKDRLNADLEPLVEATSQATD